MSAPESAPASVTSTASARRATMRLRRGNVVRLTGKRIGNSLTIAPPVSTIARASGTFSCGCSRASPPPSTATVGIRASTAA